MDDINMKTPSPHLGKLNALPAASFPHVRHSRSLRQPFARPPALAIKKTGEDRARGEREQTGAKGTTRLICPSTFYFHSHSTHVGGQSTHRSPRAACIGRPEWSALFEAQQRRAGNRAFCLRRVAFPIRVEAAGRGRLQH